LLHPVGFVLELLLKLDVLLSVGVNVLKQVDASLVLTVPLLLAGLPLLGVLLRNELVDHLLVCLLVLGNLTGVFLELNSLRAVLHALVVLKTFKSLLLVKGGI